VQADRLAAGPALDLAIGDVPHQARKTLHLLAVERGEHQLALAQVGALVQQDHRVRADDGLEDPRSLAGVEHLGWRREDLAQVLGVGVVDEGRRLEQPHGEALPVALPAALEERNRAVPPRDRLQRAR
jgi:hypothetical protein